MCVPFWRDHIECPRRPTLRGCPVLRGCCLGPGFGPLCWCRPGGEPAVVCSLLAGESVLRPLLSRGGQTDGMSSWQPPARVSGMLAAQGPERLPNDDVNKCSRNPELADWDCGQQGRPGPGARLLVVCFGLMLLVADPGAPAGPAQALGRWKGSKGRRAPEGPCTSAARVSGGQRTEGVAFRHLGGMAQREALAQLRNKPVWAPSPDASSSSVFPWGTRQII